MEDSYFKGTSQSERGITFEITALSMFRKWPVQEAHYNLKGDDGSHYVGSLTYNNENERFTFGKAICTGIKNIRLKFTDSQPSE